MFKFNRSTEYSLMALRYIRRKERAKLGYASAREIASVYGIPYDMTAKVLQRLKEMGWIASVQGARGGYALACEPTRIVMSEFIRKLEGDDTLALCLEDETCDLAARCEMKHLMIDVNQRILRFFAGIRLSEITDADVSLPGMEFKPLSRPADVAAASSHLHALGGEP